MSDSDSQRVLSMTDERVFKIVQGMQSQLNEIASKIDRVVTLEERSQHHTEALRRFGNDIDQHTHQLHKLEIWKASSGDKSHLEESIKTLNTTMKSVELNFKEYVKESEKRFIEKVIDIQNDNNKAQEELKTEIEKVDDEVESLRQTIDDVIINGKVRRGKLELIKCAALEVLKWIAVIVTSVIAFRLTKGAG